MNILTKMEITSTDIVECGFINDLIDFRYNKKTELGKCRFEKLETIEVLDYFRKMENFLNGLMLKK